VATTGFAGGAEAYIANLYGALSRRGHRVGLLGQLKTWASEIGPRVDIRSGPKWSLRTLGIGLLRQARERRELARALRQVEAKVFHLHFKREQIAFTRLLARSHPVVWTEHGIFPGGLFGMIIRPMYRRAARSAKVIVCVSEHVRKSIGPIVRNSCPVEVVPSAVDTTLFQPWTAERKAAARARLGLNPREPVVLFVGRMDAGKRPKLAIQAGLAAGTHVIVAGDGSELERLRTEFPADKVTFFGRVPSVWDIYPLADVHLFTSDGRGEGFPTVLLESAAAGIPTVATADCGFSEEIKQAGGIAADPTEPALSAAIRTVLSDSDAALGQQCRGWAMRRDYSVLVDMYARILCVEKGTDGG